MELKVENIEYTPFEKINFFDKAFKPKKVKENGIFLTKRDGIKLENEFQNININGYNFSYKMSDTDAKKLVKNVLISEAAFIHYLRNR